MRHDQLRGYALFFSVLILGLWCYVQHLKGLTFNNTYTLHAHWLGLSGFRLWYEISFLLHAVSQFVLRKTKWAKYLMFIGGAAYLGLHLLVSHARAGANESPVLMLLVLGSMVYVIALPFLTFTFWSVDRALYAHDE